MGVPLFGDADDPENYSIMSTSSDNSIRLNNNDDGKIGIENRSDNASPLQYKRKAPPAIITNKGVLGYDEASIIEGSTSKGLTFTKIIASIDLFDATASPNSQQVFTPDTSMDTKNQFNDGTPTTANADTNDNNGNTNNPSVVDDEMSNGDDKNEIISRVVPRARIPNDSKDIVNHHEKNLLSVPSQIIIPNPNSVSRVDRDMEEERERILEEAVELEKIAERYHMPNKPIATTDALAGASNYFSRAFVSTKYEDDDNFLTTMSRVRDDCVDRDMIEERERILEEAAELKKIAEWYHMPNKPIATTDALAGASNYFS